MIMPRDHVYWFLKQDIEPHRLEKSTTADIAIVGGGMAGLTAAQAFMQRGLSVIVLEKSFCGSGASGLSSGFITPNSELGLSHYVRELGPKRAKEIWDFVNGGVNLVDSTIKKFNLRCDYIKEDTLIVANNLAGFGETLDEYNAFQKLGFESQLYHKEELSKIIGSTAYFGGMSFGNTFGINCFQYLQQLKNVLVKNGVVIHEETPAIEIVHDKVRTPYGTVQAKHIVVCVDRWLPELRIIPSKVFQVQTVVMASEILDQDTIKKIFPEKRFMAWDTDLVYQYYRLTHDNRFVIGGCTMLQSYRWSTNCHPKSVIKKLYNYVQEKFPEISINFEYVWPGMIGVSKDLTAIAGTDTDNKHVYFVSAATGLPWAAALGNYAAEHLIDGRSDFDEIFSPKRSFPLPDGFHYLIGKANTFALSDFISLKLT